MIWWLTLPHLGWVPIRILGPRTSQPQCHRCQESILCSACSLWRFREWLSLLPHVERFLLAKGKTSAFCIHHIGFSWHANSLWSIGACLANFTSGRTVAVNPRDYLISRDTVAMHDSSRHICPNCDRRASFGRCSISSVTSQTRTIMFCILGSIPPRKCHFCQKRRPVYAGIRPKMDASWDSPDFPMLCIHACFTIFIYTKLRNSIGS